MGLGNKMRKEIIGNNTLYQADCRDILPEIKGIDCVFTDVPYLLSTGGCSTSSTFGSKKKWQKSGADIELLKSGKIFKHNDITEKEYMHLIYDTMNDDAHIYVMMNSLHLSNIEIEMRNVGFHINNILVMRKNNCVTNQWYMKNAEFNIFGRKAIDGVNAKALNDMSFKSVVDVIMPSGVERLHETEKPVDYVSLHVNNSTAKGDLVLDPFMGSGTTGIACTKYGRNFIGIEKDEKHFDTACIRIEEELKQGRLF